MSRRLALLSICAALAAPGLSQAQAKKPAPAAAGPAPSPGQEYIQFNFIVGAAVHCGWLSELEHQAMEASTRERLAAIGASGDAELVVGAFLRGQESYAKGQALACDSPQAQTGKTQTHASVARLINIWAARADALAASPQPWAAKITSIDPVRPGLAAGLAKIAGGSLSLTAGAKLEAERSLLLICDERRTTRSDTPRACPAATAADKPFVPYARTFVEQAEAFAPIYAASAGEVGAPLPAVASDARPLNLSSNALAQAAATRPAAPAVDLAATLAALPKPAAPPPPVVPSFLRAGELMTSYFKWIPGDQGATLSFDAPMCGKGDLVIKPDHVLGGATLSTGVLRLGETKPIGQASVRSGRTGVQFLLLDPDAAAKAAGLSAGGVFKQCHA